MLQVLMFKIWHPYNVKVSKNTKTQLIWPHLIEFYIFPISHDAINYLDSILQHLFYDRDNLSIACFFFFWFILGSDFNKCIANYPDEIHEIEYNFELMKRSICDKEFIAIPIPECIRELESYKEQIENSEKYQGLKVVRGKVHIPIVIIRDLYSKVIDEIKRTIYSLVKEHPISVIILVGGFSESDLVFESLKVFFKDIQFLRPHESGLSILKGAVMYGFQHRQISGRDRKSCSVTVCDS